jgi:hypothetical protein
MANAERDENNVPTLVAVDQTDGRTIVPVCADPTTHSLCVSDGSTGDDYGPADAPRDENFVPVLLAVSSADGVTPVVVYADLDGKLLIDMN